MLKRFSKKSCWPQSKWYALRNINLHAVHSVSDEYMYVTKKLSKCIYLLFQNCIMNSGFLNLHVLFFFHFHKWILCIYILNIIFEQESVWISFHGSWLKCTPVFKCKISTWIFRFSTKRTMLLEFRYKFNILMMNCIHLQLEHFSVGVCLINIFW